MLTQTTDLGRDPATGWKAGSLRGVHLAAAHRRGHHWTAPLYCYFESGRELHDWIEEYATHRRRCYIYTDDVRTTLTLTDWWARIESRSCRLVPGQTKPTTPEIAAKLIVSESDEQAIDIAHRSESPTDAYIIQAIIAGVNVGIYRYRTLGKSFQWCNHSQYLTATEEEIASSLNFHWTHDGSYQEGQSHVYRHVVDRVHLWLAFHQQFADWWLAIDGGPWGPTAAALAYQFLRRRLTPRTVLHHNDERVGELEKQAIHGGRRSVWFVGNIGNESTWDRFKDTAPARSRYGCINSPMVHFDVRSMYPFILNEMQFPIERIKYLRKTSVAQIQELLKSFGVVARCKIQTYRSELPYRDETGVCYPIGVFWTTLAGPEIIQAIGNGEILDISSAAIYKLGRPFQRATNHLLDLRGQYREQQNRAWEMLVKQLSNSMSGKLAANSYIWEARSKIVAPHQWGPWILRGSGGTIEKTYQVRCGMVWERVKIEESIRPMGASYAYLTSFGRLLMSIYRRLLPPNCILSQDTDGLWCTEDAIPYLEYPSDTMHSAAGELHRDHSSTVGRFWGPQTYWHSGGYVLTGLRRPIVEPGHEIAYASQNISIVDSSTDTPLPLIYSKEYQCGLFNQHPIGEIDSKGWVLPRKVHHMD